MAVAQTLVQRKQERRAFTMDTLPWWVRTCYVVFGVVLPLMSFGMAVPMRFADWQSGEWYDYAGMLICGWAAMPFYPLLLFASVSLFLLVVNPSRFGRSGVVAVGLGVGLLLGLQYAVLMLPALMAMNGGGYEGADNFAIGGFMLTGAFIGANGLRMLVAWKRPRMQYPGWARAAEVISAVSAMIVCVVSVVIFPLGMMFSSVMYGLAFGSALTRFFSTRMFDW